jgi:undecaprenyl-diphosphatase
MENWLQQLIDFLPEGRIYLLVLCVIAFAESLPAVGLIVPGSTLIVFAGFLVLHGKGSLLPLMLVTMIGAFWGDILSFWLGSHYGSKLLKLRYFQRYHNSVETSEHFFVHHGGKSIFFARFLGPIRGITPFIAGLSGMRKRAFSIYAAISAILWGICYPGLGYLGGNSWQSAQSLSARFGLVIGGAFVATLLHYWIRHYFRND